MVLCDWLTWDSVCGCSVMEGLDGLPDVRPLLIVGNHQLMGIDTSVLVEKVFKDKGILVRGLVHPFVVPFLLLF